MKADFQPPAPLDPKRFSATRIFSDRQEMIRGLMSRLPLRPRVIEVGIGLGDFSAFILDTLSPSQFVAIDLFRMHELEWLWGRRTTEIFSGLTHEQFFRNRFSSQIDRGQVKVLSGTSWDLLASLADSAFDLVYVDAGHDFASVMKDLEASLGCLAPKGVIVANDYTLYDPYLDVVYGVVQAVNRFVLDRDFIVEGFALEPNMFCDIAISRRT